MSSIIEREIAERTLISFFSKMNEWEVEGIAIKESASDWPYVLGRQLDAIYSEFLTSKPRNYGRITKKGSTIICTSIGTPPEYDCKYELIQDYFADGRNIVIETFRSNPIMAAFSFKMRYFFKMENGKCKIDKKEKFSAVKDKWIKECF